MADNERNEFIEEMRRARQIAKTFFPTTCDELAVEEIYDYLQGTDDEEEWAADMKDTIEVTKIVYEIEAPTPRQVFGQFNRRYGGE